MGLLDHRLHLESPSRGPPLGVPLERRYTGNVVSVAPRSSAPPRTLWRREHESLTRATAMTTAHAQPWGDGVEMVHGSHGACPRPRPRGSSYFAAAGCRIEI